MKFGIGNSQCTEVEIKYVCRRNTQLTEDRKYFPLFTYSYSSLEFQGCLKSQVIIARFNYLLFVICYGPEDLVYLTLEDTCFMSLEGFFV
jgi:hypothetical protein